MTHKFLVNDREIDSEAEFAALSPHLPADPARHRIALYLRDTAAMLSAILRLRDLGAGVFPIHPDTPRELARAMAARARCDRLLSDEGLEILAGEEPGASGRLVHLSSGTTGKPKVIARSWASVETETAAYVSAFSRSRIP